MKHAIFFAALAASLMSTATAFAHDGHGLGGAHWHATDEGFRGRKPIDSTFLRSHRGDSPSDVN